MTMKKQAGAAMAENLTDAAAGKSALHGAASASQYALEAAARARRAAQAAEIAEAAAGIAQNHASGLRCLIQIRIGQKRIRYSSASHASEALAAEYAHCQFGPHAKEGETISITAHAAPMKGGEP